VTGTPARAGSALWLSLPGIDSAFGDDTHRLLIAMAATGSLSAAAEHLGVSYRKAWGDLRHAERSLGLQLVQSSRGGRTRGGSSLTETGKRWIAAWSRMRQDVDGAIARAVRDRLGEVLDSAALSERPPMPTLLLIGAEGRNAGKTELACRIIGRFSNGREIVAVKVTTVHEGGRSCPRGGEGCGACSGFDRFCITEEGDRSSGKDTAKMLASGAARVLWLRCRHDCLREGTDALRGRIGAHALVVAESNSLAEVVGPGLFLMVRAGAPGEPKPSAVRVRRWVDRTVISDGSAFDLDLGAIAVRAGEWRLLEASAAILAGGTSTRMGEDKSMFPAQGRPLIALQIDQLRDRFREVLIIANEPERYRFTGLRVVGDREAGRGPLMGIASALEAARGDPVFAIACDIPEIEPRFLRELLAAAGGFDAAIPRRRDGRLEPLFAVWRRSALPAFRAALAAGERRIVSVLPRLRVRTVEMDEAAWLRNLNTADDVAAWLAATRS